MCHDVRVEPPLQTLTGETFGSRSTNVRDELGFDKQGFDSSDEVKHNNSIDYHNNVISHEKVIQKDSEFLLILRVKNVNRLIIGNLNISSISNKFGQIKLFVQGKADILIVTETKLDSTFHTSQLMIDGYSEPCPFDRIRNGGGVLIYIQEDIRGKLLVDHKLTYDIEGFFLKYQDSINRLSTPLFFFHFFIFFHFFFCFFIFGRNFHLFSHFLTIM